MEEMNDLRTPHGSGHLKQLVTEIMDDAEALVKEHVALAKAELTESMTKAKSATIAMAAGGAIAFFGAFFFFMALAMLLDTYTALPAWAAYGIVAVGLMILAAILFFVGKAKLTSMEKQPLPKTKGALKEDARWVTNLAHSH